MRDARPGLTTLYVLAGLRTLFSLVTHGGYGIFRDELYYLACAEHLDFGYVDHPPLIAWLTWLARGVGGDSLLALRFLPALFGGATVFVAGLLARELGGGRWAMALACVVTACSPVLLSFAHFHSMNVVEVLLWSLAAYLLVRLARDASARRWLAFGAVCGIGLLNKHSMLFFGFGAALAILVDPSLRRQLRTPWPYVAFVVALVLFAPNLIWQLRHDFPTLEFMANARAHKNLPLSPGSFLREQVLMHDPFVLPVWLAGLWFTLRARDEQAHARPLGIVYLTLLAVMLATQAKAYYLAAAYPMLFAAGGVAVAGWGERYAKVGVAVALVGGLVGLPMAVPVLSQKQFVQYAAALGVEPGSAERQQLGQLPQFFADMHGWQAMANDVARAFRKLSAHDQRSCAIFANNYGGAGAIDFFGPALGLPRAISGHNSYFLWGPRDTTGECVLVIGGDPEDHLRAFQKAEPVGESRDAFRMPYENVTLWLLHGPRAPIETLWPASKHYD